MGKNFYLLNNGKLIKKNETIYFVSLQEQAKDVVIIDDEDESELTIELEELSKSKEFSKKALPVELIDTLYLYGQISLTSGVIAFLSKKQIPVHFFGYYGHYLSTLYPKAALLSGEMHVRQALCYADHYKRLHIACSFVTGSARNMVKNLEYYSHQERGLENKIVLIKELIDGTKSATTVSELMAIEGRIRQEYYSAFDDIMPGIFKFESRSRRPPQNQINAMLSFGNSLVYAEVLNALYHTQLDPTISFLHEPSERRFSLALDISEIFKPLFVDRVIFKLVNKKMVDEDSFKKELKSCLLNERGKRVFLSEYEEKINTTIKHRSLRRNVSYKRLIYLECLKVAKHCLGIQEYNPFVIWW